MKHQQVRTVLVVWAFFMVASCLFPPWEGNYDIEVDGVKYGVRGVSNNFPFRFILDPPQKSYLDPEYFINNKVYSDMQNFIIYSAKIGYYIDIRRLLVIWMIITVTFGTALALSYNTAVNADKMERMVIKSRKRQEKEQAKKNIIDKTEKENNAP